MHDNDSITEQFAMNVIAWAFYKKTPDVFPDLVLPLPDLTRTELTVAQQAFTMRNQDTLRVLSDA
jgi:hypothetical protein